MNKRCKSQRIIKNHLKDQRVNELIQQLEQSQIEIERLEDIESKVEQSKPILNTIYQKVKARETKYSQQIHQLQNKIVSNQSLKNQYKKLFEDGVRIMEKNNIVQKFIQKTNYRKISHQYSQKYPFFKTNYKEDQLNKINGKETNFIQENNIYKRYKEKIGERIKKPEVKDKDNQQRDILIEKTHNLNALLKQKMKKMSELKIFKTHDLSTSKKSKSMATLPKHKRMMNEQFLKERLIQMKKDKL